MTMAHSKDSFSVCSGSSSQACQPATKVDENVSFRLDENRSLRSSRRRERQWSPPSTQRRREDRRRSRRDRSRSREQGRRRSSAARFESELVRRPSWPSPSPPPFCMSRPQPSSPYTHSPPPCLLPVDIEGYTTPPLPPPPSPSRSRLSSGDRVLSPGPMGEQSTEDLLQADSVVSDRERLQAGRDFASRFLSSEYFCASATTRREKRIVPISGFRHRDTNEKGYPIAAKMTVEAVSEVLKDRRDPASIPVSAVDYEASAYRLPEPMWNPESDNFLPFRGVNSREAAPPTLRRSMQSAAAAFDVLAYIKTLADAQVKALSAGFSSEQDMLAFHASTEALALASSDALALTSLSLANSTLFVRHRALGQLKVSTTVKEQALKSELTPEAWFGPAALTAVEEEKRDPTVQARAIGSAISGAFSKAVRQSAPPSRSARQPFRNRGGRRGSATNSASMRNTSQLGEFARGRGYSRARGQRGTLRGSRKPSATSTSRDQ